VIGLSTLQHVQMNDWLALSGLPFTPLHRLWIQHMQQKKPTTNTDKLTVIDHNLSTLHWSNMDVLLSHILPKSDLWLPVLHQLKTDNDTTMKTQLSMNKVLRETQTLRAGCSNVEPKFFAPPQSRRMAKI